ncbi:hypothetical protein Ct61P_15107 [Colletotrichum tofieldiae]|nr:hypothetical protein Ct61P_15107 [Colletotrichum tofieldiae]
MADEALQDADQDTSHHAKKPGSNGVDVSHGEGHIGVFATTCCLTGVSALYHDGMCRDVT